MKKLTKVLLITVIVLLALLAVAISATIGWRPILGPSARPATARSFERTPQRLQRGQYLANAVSGCLFCHSEHDWASPGEPIVAGTEGAGQIAPYAGLPGRIVAANITPDRETGLGNWSDDEIARAIREGVDRDGGTLFPLMPYEKFRNMSDEDVASVVVYLRSLPAVRHELPKTEVIFPVRYLIRNAPQPLTAAVTSPSPSDRLAWGTYLTTITGCDDCHTSREKGQVVPGMNFAGGIVFQDPAGQAASANITPDASGIAYYNEDLFLKMMRTGFVQARKINPVMPYTLYGKMTDDDLKAIFGYLRTLKPVHHRVDNSLPPTYCKLCRQKHGAGDQN